MIQDSYSFSFGDNKYFYNAEKILAYKNSVAITLDEFMAAKALKAIIDEIKVAFSILMGVNGDKYVDEICETIQLCQRSYDEICANIKFNSKDSIVKYFGLVHYYYLQGK